MLKNVFNFSSCKIVSYYHKHFLTYIGKVPVSLATATHFVILLSVITDSDDNLHHAQQQHPSHLHDLYDRPQQQWWFNDSAFKSIVRTRYWFGGPFFPVHVYYNTCCCCTYVFGNIMYFLMNVHV